MQQSQNTLLLSLVLLLEVLFLIFYNHLYFGVYVDVAIFILACIAIYLGYRYYQINSKMPLRVTELKSNDHYEFMVERLRRSEIDKLLKTKRMQQLEKLKTSRLSSISKKEDDDSFIRQLKQKEQQIFDFQN